MLRAAFRCGGSEGGWAGAIDGAIDGAVGDAEQGAAGDKKVLEFCGKECYNKGACKKCVTDVLLKRF